VARLEHIKKNFLHVSKSEAISVLEGIRQSRLIVKKSTKSKSLKKKIARKFELEDMLDKLSLEDAEMFLAKINKGEL